MPDPQGWSLILHGGAKTIAAHKFDRNRRGLLAATEAGAAILAAGGSAVDAVEAAIRVLEDDPTFNAGYGSVLNSDGAVEMDAAIMDGRNLDLGGVAAVQGVRNPITAAKLMLPETPTLLTAHGARRFAAAHGAELCEAEAMISREQDSSEAERAHDTVGCVARDMAGALAAGTSTGGLPGKAPGRIGDSPLPGCGLYADNLVGGVSLSGDGERISRTLVAAAVMTGLETDPASAAAERGIARLGRVGGEAGCIVLDRAGRFGCAHNSDHFALGAAASWLDGPRALLHRDEMQDLLDHD